jgi:hypothetical protein
MSGALLLQRCITPRAVLRGGAWRYPPPRLLRPGQWSAARLAAFVEALLQLPPIGERRAVGSGEGMGGRGSSRRGIARRRRRLWRRCCGCHPSVKGPGWEGGLVDGQQR